TNLMATEQCFYALVAAKRFKEGKTPLFDMADVPKTSNTGIGLPGKDTDVKISEIKFPGKTFSDIVGHKNQTAIEKLAERGIINGISENSFVPDRVVTRAEFAAITVRALGLPRVQKTPEFADVNALDWHAQYVGAAYSYGIINGVSKTEFNPNGEITIEQASAMVERAAKLCGKENLLDSIAVKNVLAGFTDYMTVSRWAKPSVAFCFENNILDKNEIEIKPLAAAKRCQIAQMLYNMLKGARLI
ncbi:MAG: S-layer homology domain-containing protein, partial [Clostridia bacterium]|nr:S-layer homology domain-containing protein [Clostridia bacterium]